MDALGCIAYTLDALKVARDLLAAFDETLQHIAEFPSAHKIYCTGRPMKDEICKVPVKNESEVELMKNKTTQKYIPRRRCFELSAGDISFKLPAIVL